MNELWTQLAMIAGSAGLFVLLTSLLLTALGRLGGIGRATGRWLSRAPGLDIIVALLTWVPWVPGIYFGGWRGFLAVLVGQFIALHGWVFIHEMLNREAVRGPRIVKFINRRFGRLQNHLALWVTSIALPGFWIIRLQEIICYPFLVWLLRFPRYNHGEWINASRQKFEGLVGHDLIWCLYCDWMTGVYSLGAEMLRNVESFWCPIRFYDGKKCDNCKVDFPDIEGGWVRADGHMADVEKVLEEQYGDADKPAAWFGHPVRATVNGKPQD